jgi:hypothetical protein
MEHGTLFRQSGTGQEMALPETDARNVPDGPQTTNKPSYICRTSAPELAAN